MYKRNMNDRLQEIINLLI